MKHSSLYIRVHPCRLQPLNNHSTCKPDDQVPSNKTDQQARTDFESDSDDDRENSMHNNVLLIQDNPDIITNQFQVQNRCHPKNKVEPTVIQSDNRAMQTVAVKNNVEKPKIKQHVEIRANDGKSSRRSKLTGKYSNWHNIQNLNDNSLKCINWDNLKEWRLNQIQVKFYSLMMNRMISLNSYKQNYVN